MHQCCPLMSLLAWDACVAISLHSCILLVVFQTQLVSTAVNLRRRSSTDQLSMPVLLEVQWHRNNSSWYPGCSNSSFRTWTH